MNVELQGSARLSKEWNDVAAILRAAEVPEKYSHLRDWTIVIRPSTEIDRDAPTGGCYSGYDPDGKRAAYAVTLEEDEEASDNPTDRPQQASNLLWQLDKTIEENGADAFGNV